jgi:hypothetical protein
MKGPFTRADEMVAVRSKDRRSHAGGNLGLAEPPIFVRARRGVYLSTAESGLDALRSLGMICFLLL